MRILLGTWSHDGLSAEFIIVTRARKGGAVTVLRVSIPTPAEKGAA